MFLAYGLLRQPKWRWIESTFSWSKEYWALTGSFILGIVLLNWLAVQGVLIGFRWPIQFVITTNGLLILIFAALPGVRKYFAR